mmetsp:Transcript_88443/g.202310  ORF Transcript_88443/g.202310 Transcript_88443/m.202310 type:complete len:251 (-) Transcript_88443:2-754(-)
MENEDQLDDVSEFAEQESVGTEENSMSPFEKLKGDLEQHGMIFHYTKSAAAAKADIYALMFVDDGDEESDEVMEYRKKIAAMEPDALLAELQRVRAQVYRNEVRVDDPLIGSTPGEIVRQIAELKAGLAQADRAMQAAAEGTAEAEARAAAAEGRRRAAQQEQWDQAAALGREQQQLAVRHRRLEATRADLQRQTITLEEGYAWARNPQDAAKLNPAPPTGRETILVFNGSEDGVRGRIGLRVMTHGNPR